MVTCLKEQKDAKAEAKVKDDIKKAFSEAMMDRSQAEERFRTLKEIEEYVLKKFPDFVNIKR